jgi:hypothetical protein
MFPTVAAQEELTGLINGQKARSLGEWWVARALWKLKRRFLYQYSVGGAENRRGNIILDFVLIDGPITIIEYQGERWHKGQFGSRDKMREGMIRSMFGVIPLYIWQHESKTEYDTYRAVRKALNG